MEKRAIYHFWVRMPGGRRAHRYCVATPDGNYVGPFWSRKEVADYAAGNWSISIAVSADVHSTCYAGATFVGWTVPR